VQTYRLKVARILRLFNLPVKCFLLKISACLKEEGGQMQYFKEKVFILNFQ